MLIIRHALAGALLAAGLWHADATPLAAQSPPVAADVQLTAETFAALRAKIKPQPGESRWMEIPWLTDVHAARQKAAAEGKPLFVYSGGGATGIGPC
jgi:hypothetical protein